jgi:hypothetical protein
MPKPRSKSRKTKHVAERERAADRREQAEKDGLCSYLCGRAREGGSTCPECREKYNARRRKGNMPSAA